MIAGLTVSVALLLMRCSPASSHGRLIEPPGRSTMWRYGFNTPHNYNDNQLFCGGKQYQWGTHGGMCGLCGDPYGGPRENEAGGKYATGTIARCYKTALSVLEVKVEITAHHKGYFEFRLCENNDVKKAITQECLDRHLLTVYETEDTKFYPDDVKEIYTILLDVPPELTCSQCVLQWKYNTGNSYGCKIDDPTDCGIGYGPQEQFYGCSDISILESCSDDTGTNAPPTQTPAPTANPTLAPEPWTRAPTTPSPTTAAPTRSPTQVPRTTASPGGTICHAVGIYAGMSGMDQWCANNCARGFCPPSHCRCDETEGALSGSAPCDASLRYRHFPGMKTWCVTNCQRGFCPKSHCYCPDLQ